MKQCPRCRSGQLFRDEADNEWACLQCGFRPLPEGWEPLPLTGNRATGGEMRYKRPKGKAGRPKGSRNGE